MDIIEIVKSAIYDSRNTGPENQAQYVAIELLKAIEEPSKEQLAVAARYCNEHANKQTVGQAVTQSYKLMIAALSQNIESGQK